MGENILSKGKGIQAKRFKEGKEFKKENELPIVKGILLEGDFIPGREFKKLADMPSKDELLSQLIAMLNSPLQKLVSTLNAPMQDVIGVLGSLKEKK